MTIEGDALEAADTAYEDAEAIFLGAVRGHADHAVVSVACQAVADAAADWNRVAYLRFHAAVGDQRAELDLLTERTEVLQELWANLAAAYRVEEGPAEDPRTLRRRS
jgi:hypothetical protein